MQIIDNEHISAFDVDETLFMHVKDVESFTYGVKNPYSNSFIPGILNHKHVELLKQHKARGMFIVVWSKAGKSWAEAVIKHFELEQYVDLCITKFDKFVDDLPAEKILGEHIYLK